MKKRFIGVIIAAVMLAAMSCATTVSTAPQPTVEVRPEKGLVYPVVAARNAIVSTTSEYATRAGREILAKGGNVVDAAIAVSFALGVHEMSLSGLGGEGTMLINMTGMQEPIVIDFKGEVPERLKEVWNKEGKAPKSVLVPGVVAGCWEAYKRYGSKKVSWAELVAPAIRYATEGMPLNARQAQDILGSIDGILENDYLKQSFSKDGLPIEAGDAYKLPLLAQTLKAIASGGADAFYKGELAKKMAADSQKDGGVLTEKDFANYQAKVYSPLKGRYRGMDVYSTPGATGGLGLINILQVLDQFDLKSMGYMSPQHIHVMLEAEKMGLADSTSYGDDLEFSKPDYARLLSQDYAKARASLIKKDSIVSAADAMNGLDKNAIVPVSGHTTHFVVADKDGNMVSWTQTLSGLFGSKWASNSTGVIFNNEMGNFIGAPQLVQPRRRVRTTIAPTFLFKDGKPYMAVGAPGSITIVPAIVNVIVNVVDFDKSIQAAIGHPLTPTRASSASSRA